MPISHVYRPFPCRLYIHELSQLLVFVVVTMLKTESNSSVLDGVDLTCEEVTFTDAYYPFLPSFPSGFITSSTFPYQQELQPQAVTCELHSLVSPSSVKRPRFNLSRPSSLITSYQYNNLPIPIHSSSSSSSSSSSRLVSNNELARRRRQKISDKTRCLSKLMPWDTQMDTATMLEEARKYVMFLQAQVKCLQSMPPISSFIHYNGTTSFDVKDNEKGGGNGGGVLEMLNRQQLLQVLVNSPVVQTRLYKHGCCVYSIEQLMMMMLPSGSTGATTTSTSGNSRSF